MRLASMNWNDKPNLLKACCHSAAEAVPATPALHVGSHRGPVRFNLVQNTSGLKHGVPNNGRFNFNCQPYAKLQLAIRLVPRLVPIPRIQTPGRWISASGSSRHGTQSSHVAPARNARCNVMCNVMCKVMCHVIATLMVIWLFKLRKPAGKLASCYSRTKWE